MAAASRAIFCELSSAKRLLKPPKDSPPAAAITRADGGGKILLQPRLCTLRSYSPGSSRDGVVRRLGDGGAEEASNFFASLADYIESSKKSQDFEIVSGRLAMLAFAATVSVEFVTGNSLFKKLELQQIAEAAGLCVAVVALAAAFAWFSSARARIGQMFTLSCNQFVDSLIDDLVDGLFFDSEPSDWSDDASL